MKRVVFVLAWFIPILVAIGVLRRFFVPNEPFLKSWEALMEDFASMPDFGGMLYRAQLDMLSTFDEFGQMEVVDWFSFWAAVGKFFEGIGYAFNLGFTFLSIPFRFVVWVCYVILGPAANNTISVPDEGSPMNPLPIIYG